MLNARWLANNWLNFALKPDDEAVRVLAGHPAAVENPHRAAKLYRAAADLLERTG